MRRWLIKFDSLFINKIIVLNNFFLRNLSFNFKSKKESTPLFIYFMAWHDISVTRFDEIPPLWQKIKTLNQLFVGLFIAGQIFEPTLANLLYLLASFHCSKWPNIKQQLKSSGHTAWHPLVKEDPVYNFVNWSFKLNWALLCCCRIKRSINIRYNYSMRWHFIKAMFT